MRRPRRGRFRRELARPRSIADVFTNSDLEGWLVDELNRTVDELELVAAG